MAVSPKRFRPSLDPERLRIRRLDTVSQAACYWLLFCGALELFMGWQLSMWLHLRYIPEATPLTNSLGLSYLILGIYLRRTLHDPENQYLSVDLLLLFFWIQLIMTLKNALDGIAIFGGEWFIYTVNFVFALALIILRTPSSRMAGAGATKDASVAARETIDRLKELLERRKRRIPPLEEDPSAPQLPLHKPVSEVTPHMD